MLYFAGHDAMNGWQLWRTDGTQNGTVLFKNLRLDATTPSVSLRPRNFIDVDGELFFAASDGTSGYQLWRSDGTESGTVRVKDVEPVIVNSTIEYLAVADGVLFFAANDSANGRELWRSDGTEAGTALVKDIYPGSGSGFPSSLTTVNGTLFFAADREEYGVELWKSDGTATGTMMVRDIWPGARGSYSFGFTSVNGSVFFTADDGYHGTELWVLHPPVGDLDRNHYLNTRDIDLLFAAVASGENDSAFDLNGDSLVNHDDITHLVESTLRSKFGDANLDGAVDRQDLSTVVANFGQAGGAGWARGDFNGDGTVDLRDLMILQAGFNGDSSASAQAIVAATSSQRRMIEATPDIGGNDSSRIVRTRHRTIGAAVHVSQTTAQQEELVTSASGNEAATSTSRIRAAASRRISQVDADAIAARSLDAAIELGWSPLSTTRRTRKR
jgi:ELWxxDGT repeat protein